jgi:hypothetical protein
VSPTSPDIRSPARRISERIGSKTNSSNFVFLEGAVNLAKGRFEVFRAPMAKDVLEDRVET